MSGAVRIAHPGAQTTVQDLGRAHVGAFGVSPSGALDTLSARAANLLVGNEPHRAVLETTLSGVGFVPSRDCTIAVCGALADLHVGGRAQMLWAAVPVGAGEEVRVGLVRAGARSYVAIDGGFVGDRVLGSESTDVSAAFGGVDGRRVRAGDEVLIGSARAPATRAAGAPEWLLRRPAVLRVLPGPHLHVDAQQRLFAQTYRMSRHSNRQAVRLEGPPLPDAGGTDVPPLGVAAGFVQLTSAGLPIVLLAEHQATGGYAVPWCVITADVPVAAQLAPGDEIRFEPVSRHDAVRALREQEAWLWRLSK